MSKKSRFSEEDLELDEIGQPSSSSHNKKKSSTTGQKKGYNNNKEAGLSTFVESPMQMRDVDIGHGEHRFSNAENERDRYMRERKMSVAVSPAADTEQRAKERQEAEISDREKRPKRKPLSKRVIERIAKWWRFMYHKRGRQRFFCGVTLLDWVYFFLTVQFFEIELTFPNRLEFFYT